MNTPFLDRSRPLPCLIEGCDNTADSDFGGICEDCYRRAKREDADDRANAPDVI